MLAVLAGFPAAALAQDATGDWLGSLQTGPLTTLRLAVHVKSDGHGGFQGTLDSLDQNTRGLPLSDVAATPEALSFKVPAVGGAYSGKWDAAAHAWVGEWRQGATPLPLTLARPPAQPIAWTIPSDAEIGRLLEARIAGRPGEGIVVGIITPSGRRIVARGPADTKRFDGRTLFEIGSITKVFTGLLLADMARRGEVRLDDPADKYLPAGYALPSRNGRRITLLDLATHRSGLPRMPTNFTSADPANPYADYSQKDLLAYLKQVRLTRDIGSEYEYSNLGVGLLGQLLARRAGTDYASLVRRRITRPLGMMDTTIRLSPVQRTRLAQPHDEYMRPMPAWDLNALAAAGALRSDANDLLTFLGAAMGLVKRPVRTDFAAMQVRRAAGPTGNMDVGIIWMLLKTPAAEIVFHNGATGGSKAFIGFDPARKRGVVVLVNGAPEPASDDLGLHLLTGSPPMPVQPLPPAPREWKVVPLSPAQLDPLTGIYRFGPQETLTIRRDADRLTVQLTGQPEFPIFPSSETEFFLKAVDAQLSFELDGSGRASKVVLHQAGHDTPAPREP
jgi:CubicO group peptidase (beta-lactamase class C family)